MVLLEEFDVTLRVGANGLGETDRDGMEVIEIDGGIALEFAADNWVVAPLDLDKVGNTLAPIFLGNF